MTTPFDSNLGYTEDEVRILDLLQRYPQLQHLKVQSGGFNFRYRRGEIHLNQTN